MVILREKPEWGFMNILKTLVLSTLAVSAVGSVSAADVDQLKINTTATTSTTLASGADSVAIGQDAKTADTAKNSIAIGKGASSQHQAAISLGQ